VNFLRFKKVQNFQIFRNIFNENYFFSTKTNFYKKNNYYKNEKFKNYRKIFPLIKKSNYIIHVGSSTSSQNLILSKYFKKKIFFKQTEVVKQL